MIDFVNVKIKLIQFFFNVLIGYDVYIYVFIGADVL
jgi:hypothetical protein